METIATGREFSSIAGKSRTRRICRYDGMSLPEALDPKVKNDPIITFRTHVRD